jgi:hypothetical protein
LGGVYFIVSGLEQFIHTYLREYDSYLLRLIGSLFVIPSALLDTLFYYWIFWAIYRTIGHLRMRKQEEKLKMYERLFWILIFGAVLTVAIVFLESFVFLLLQNNRQININIVLNYFYYNLHK